jgi:hypothetical protein
LKADIPAAGGLMIAKFAVFSGTALWLALALSAGTGEALAADQRPMLP